MSKLLIASLSLLATAVALTGCSQEATDNHPNQPVTKRRAVFKEFTRTLEPMGMVARDRETYNAATFLVQAQALQKLSTQPWPLFTADSDYPPTKADAKVWQQPDEFKKAQLQFQQVVGELVQAAAENDQDHIKTSVNNVQKSCKACHEAFRKDRLY